MRVPFLPFPIIIFVYYEFFQIHCSKFKPDPILHCCQASVRSITHHGQNSNAQQFGTINYYDNSDITNWCSGLVLQQTYGLRTFWDLQQNQEIQRDEEWQKKMIDIEMRVSQNPDFQRIAFFHHLIFEKRG